MPSFVTINVVLALPMRWTGNGIVLLDVGSKRDDLRLGCTLTRSLRCLINSQYSPSFSVWVVIEVFGNPPGVLCFLASSPPAFWRYAHKPEEGRPTARRDMFAATTSDSVLDIDTEVCFFENAVNGKYVLGPMSTRKPPVVLRLSYSPA